jgi:hypothetical protein
MMRDNVSNSKFAISVALVAVLVMTGFDLVRGWLVLVIAAVVALAAAGIAALIGR